MQPRRVLLDTNILLAVAGGFDLIGQLESECPGCEAVVLEGTLTELKKLEETGNGKEKAAARLAAQLVEKQDLNIASQSDPYVDAALLEEAKRVPAYLATIDRELQKRARAQGIPVLTVKKRRLLRPAS